MGVKVEVEIVERVRVDVELLGPTDYPSLDPAISPQSRFDAGHRVAE